MITDVKIPQIDEIQQMTNIAKDNIYIKGRDGIIVHIIANIKEQAPKGMSYAYGDYDITDGKKIFDRKDEMINEIKYYFKQYKFDKIVISSDNYNLVKLNYTISW